MARMLRWSRFLVVPSALLVLSCGGGESEPSDTTRNLSIQSGDNQSAAVGSAVATPPSVKVGNNSGAGVPGVTVTFAVGSGGGTVTGGTQMTNAQGIATVGGWTLGQALGANTLTVTVQGGTSTVTINATATAGPAAALVKQAGDNQNATVKSAVATKPAVRVNDQFGNPVQGAAVVFTVTGGGGTVTGGTQNTDPQGIATVGAWTLGPTNGSNKLSAVVQGVAAIPPQVFTANGQEILIQPGVDTTFQGGTLNLTRLVIPAGRVVTVAGTLTINADSTIVINGTLRGTCVGITINSEKDYQQEGSLNNACAESDATSPSIKVVAKGGYELNGGSTVSSGDIEFTNDATLTDNDFQPPSPALRAGAIRADHICGASNTVVAPPEGQEHARDGSNGQHGGDGSDGRTYTMRCRGDGSIAGNVRVFGQNGGNGGTGTHSSNNAADATGGNGGKGGKLRIEATGILAIGGPGNHFRPGKGGNGGAATATGTEGKTAQRAAGAIAEGGNGAAPGLISFRGNAGIQIADPFQITLGTGGDGGDATATGASGKQGLNPTESSREQDGGNADASGGTGGDTPDKQLTGSGDILGDNPNTAGGNAGKGGKATANGGNGAEGTENKPDGGLGGAMSATAGRGGNAQARGLGGALIGNGGNGGASVFKDGRGGDGWDNCIDLVRLAGDGGTGGGANGSSGTGGTGLAAGQDGGVTYISAGNGGNGGDHKAAPGDGGGAGGAGVTEHPPVTGKDTSFKPGQPGKLCPGLVQLSLTEIIFQHIALVTSCPQTAGTIEVTNVSQGPVTVNAQVMGTNVLQLQGTGVVLQPGGKSNLTVIFNCSQAFSFTATVRITATPQGGGDPQVTDVPVQGQLKMRAVRLAQALGPFASGTVIQQSRITNWQFGAAHPPNCATDHLHSSSMAGILIDGAGPFPDPNPTGCGYGEVILLNLPPAP